MKFANPRCVCLGIESMSAPTSSNRSRAHPLHQCIQHNRSGCNSPKNANRSLNPRLPWSKLLCVTTNHLTSSVSILSPSLPSILMYTLSSFSGSSFTSKSLSLGFGRDRTGATIAAGVDFHLGWLLSCAESASVGCARWQELEKGEMWVEAQGAAAIGDEVARVDRRAQGLPAVKRRRRGDFDAMERADERGGLSSVDCLLNRWPGRSGGGRMGTAGK